VRKTQERIATLNVFSSINVTLEDAYVPQESKTVIITVVELPPQYVEVRPGLSTGEGFRFAFEYGHRNLGGDAIGLSLRVQLSYLPNFLILDPQVYTNFNTLSDGERVATRSTATLAFPEIGLGPLVRTSLDGVFVRDLERDFALTKAAGIVNLFYRPIRQLQFTLSPDIERNTSKVFQFGTIQQYIQNVQTQQGSVNADLSRLLRVPDGDSYAVAERFVITWDRRDNSFNAHSGTYLVSGTEHVDWYTIGPATCFKDASGNQECEASEGHFVRFTETFAGYIPITKSITLAGELRVGANAQTTTGSATYPDRLFFLGGVESMRGWLQDTFVPQEYADSIARDFTRPDGPGKFTITNVVLRGGNFMINPRLELRILVRPPFETVLFGDAGNLWLDPTYIFDHPDKFNLRYAAGTGLRFQTPIGPLAFDYGINMSRLLSSPSDPRRTYEDFGAFHFAIGLF
jgi:outer membrane protein insertion porin family